MPEKLKKRIEQIKMKRPGYGEMLDFYQKIKEAQQSVKSSEKKPTKLKKEWKELLAKEGFSLIQKEDFPRDIETSAKLFATLCKIGINSNPYMAEQVKKIKEAINNKKIDLTKLLAEGIKEEKIKKFAEEWSLDKVILSFLIQHSLMPSIEAGRKQLQGELDSETWLKGSCPVCGSLPHLSLLKGEEGKRYLLCSYCGYEWRTDRLFCPFCNNKEQGSLNYLYAEGEGTFRIDLCDKCHQYIKTVDYRTLEESDPVLEDIATIHLDLLASQKGYQRPVPNPWTT